MLVGKSCSTADGSRAAVCSTVKIWRTVQGCWWCWHGESQPTLVVFCNLSWLFMNYSCYVHNYLCMLHSRDHSCAYCDKAHVRLCWNVKDRRQRCDSKKLGFIYCILCIDIKFYITTEFQSTSARCIPGHFIVEVVTVHTDLMVMDVK